MVIIRFLIKNLFLKTWHILKTCYKRICFSTLLVIIASCGSESTPPVPQYEYQPPALTNDGWQVGHADSVGLNTDKLSAMTRTILGGNHSVIDGIVIIKNNTLVYEHYFNGFSRDRKHELQSAVKSIDSALVGLAIQQGYLSSINQSIYPLLPDYHHLDWNGGKDQITLANLLTMRSGLPCHDGTQGSCNSQQLNQAEDWTHYTLIQPVENEPGSSFSYFTGLNIVAHTILQGATNTTIDDFAMQHLFAPMGISQFDWSHSPSGEALSGNMLPRDMAKFGQLYLNGGHWQGTQIINAQWVQDSTFEQVPVPQADGWGYGFWWWLNQTQHGDNFYAARGANDQFIFVIPSQDLVVVFTGNRDSGDAFSLLEAYILAGLN